jgi:hypothetical protein
MDAFVDALAGSWSGCLIRFDQIVRRLSAIIRQFIICQLCGRMMCMLWGGRLAANFIMDA